MLSIHGQLVYPNVYWHTSETAVLDQICACVDTGRAVEDRLLGQFAFAAERDGASYLVRDRLGINKLFYVLDPVRGALRISSSFHELAATEGDVAAIRAVPPGHVVRVDGRTRDVQKVCYHDVSATAQTPADQFDALLFRERVARQLSAVFVEIGARFPGAQFVVCLSGGLDSSVIASFAKRHLPGAVAATFSYVTASGATSDDFQAAGRISDVLGIERIPILAERAISLGEVDEVLAMCQDWRDFNVHCAWVNAMIGLGLRGRWPARQVVLLTGDLMNEYVADYAAVSYRGTEYYPQPRLSRARRRRAFVSGLDTSDREVGVFHHYGLTTIQPYAAVAEDYLSVPAWFLDRPDCKETLNLGLIGNPDVERLVTTVKVRAQVGGEDGGTLGLFHDAGITQATLRERWDGLFAGFRHQASADALIVAGRYRS